MLHLLTTCRSVNDRQKSLLEEFAKEEEILERSAYEETKWLVPYYVVWHSRPHFISSDL